MEQSTIVSNDKTFFAGIPHVARPNGFARPMLHGNLLSTPVIDRSDADEDFEAPHEECPCPPPHPHHHHDGHVTYVFQNGGDGECDIEALTNEEIEALTS